MGSRSRPPPTERRSTWPSTQVAQASATLLGRLVTTATPKDREVEAAKAHERAVRRFGARSAGPPPEAR